MRHFQEQLGDLEKHLLEMAGAVESAVRWSVRALIDRDEKLARRVLENEARINRMEMEIDEQATCLIALRQPMAVDLRFLTAAIKINTDLERMGDLAVNIVERALSLIQQAPAELPVDIPHMATLVETMVRLSLDSFVRRDGATARTVLNSDDAVDELKKRFQEELLRLLEEDALAARRAVDLLFVSHNLERIADHATNIAEDVLYLVEGVDVRHHAEVPR